MKETYTEAMKRSDVKAIVLTGKFIMDHIDGIALLCLNLFIFLFENYHYLFVEFDGSRQKQLNIFGL